MTMNVLHMFAIAFILAVLQSDEIHGCQWNSDCGEGQECCHVGQPSCMDSIRCYNMKYHAATSTDAPTTFTVPDLNFDWQAHRPEDVPDIPHSYNNEGYDDGDSTSSGTSTGVTAGGPFVLLVVISFIGYCIRYKVRNMQQQDREREMNTTRPPTYNNTNPANLVSREQSSRIVLVAVCRDREGNRDQNRAPDGEPPFLGEEDLRKDMSTNPSHELPTYEDATTAEPFLPSYEGMGSTFESDRQPLVDGGKEQDS